jgi:RNA polymerase sigma-70 factor (sigma-E family)
MLVVGVDGMPGGVSPFSVEFERFVSRGSPALLRSAYLLTGDRGHAEDLLQGTLLRVASRWDAAREAPDAYARRVLVNLSRDRWRSLGRRPRERSLVEPVADWGSDPSVGVLDRHAMTAAVGALPVRQREVVVLRFFLDLSVSETAAALGCSEGTVKSYTSRALARLRGC